MKTSQFVSLLLFVCCCSCCASPATAEDSPAREPKRWALLIGVDEYDYARGLKYCVADQQALAKSLVAAGFPERQVTLMASGAADPRLRPSKKNLRTQIELFSKLAEQGDLLLIAFSGHGVHVGKTSFLCPSDAKLDEPETLVSLEWVYEQLGNSPAELRLMFVDACRNVPPEPEGHRAATDKELQASARAFVSTAQEVPEGIILLNPCSEGEFAQEDSKLGHGVFTYHMLEGLAGKADEDKNDRITLGELFSYAGEETTFYVKDKFADSQRPKLKGDLAVGVLKYEVATITRVTKPSKPVVERKPSSPSMKPQVKKPSPKPPSRLEPTGERPELAVAPFKAKEAKAHQAAWARYLGTEVEIENSLGMKLTLIPASEFKMGSSKSGAEENEKPVHTVRLTQPYFLGTTEVTQGQWESVMGTTPWNDQFVVQERDDYPAKYVSHKDAEEFCRKLSEKEGKKYRLPTEAEWEHACRAGTKGTYHFGDDESDLRGYAWYAENAADIGWKYAHRVGLKKPNPFGLRDMHGNVSEWCSDWYDEKYYANSPQENPEGASSGSFRVFRGGCWYHNPAFCRSAVRGGDAPWARGYDLGFRLARVP